ncbi:uncharacterized protein LOC126895286 [Daktulosphaira vitifoliae]|uniref:uncharacterized protein LOC126895286 n=1 Tax=Daktulosphaira vitifoliae TaxID=58002 RepID=UPI0021AAB138|nr:uncharacterized protein LOC126895286 [Daktulosphaira vitifoliae]
MFLKCIFYLLVINFYVCLTKSDEHFKDLNILLDREAWKKLGNLWKPHDVVECNPDGQIIDVAELFKKDESQNKIVTDENYKIKVQKLFLLYSAVHACMLYKIIAVLRGFWELCEREEEKCKKLFLLTLVRFHNIFVKMLDALSFISKFKSKSPLIISDNTKNGVTTTLNHLNVLSNSNSQSNECIRVELNGAYNSIKDFFASHFRPVPLYIIDDQIYFSHVYNAVLNTINDNNKTLNFKLTRLITTLFYQITQYNDYHKNELGFCFHTNSHLVEPIIEQNTIRAPEASDDEDDG